MNDVMFVLEHVAPFWQGLLSHAVGGFLTETKRREGSIEFHTLTHFLPGSADVYVCENLMN